MTGGRLRRGRGPKMAWRVRYASKLTSGQETFWDRVLAQPAAGHQGI